MPSLTTQMFKNLATRAPTKPLPSTSSADPLTLALLPPADEDPTTRSARVQAEKAAKLRSDEIDRFLHSPSSSSPSLSPGEERRKGRGGGRTYKMVLLGQAGAGKTTVLKQMRLLYDPESHEKERKGWARIVLLNLMGSIRVLLDVLDQMKYEVNVGLGSLPEAAELQTNDVLQHLSKVRELEKELRAELGAFREETLPSSAPLVLRAGWQDKVLCLARKSFSQPTPTSASPVSQLEQDTDSDTRALDFLQTISPSFLALWTTSPLVKTLKKKGLLLDGQNDSATTYFLDNASRILFPNYSPSDSDILHSRVRTLGITSHTFAIDKTLSYTIFDVGGSRSQRAAWVPFLSDSLDAIIFLAPLSAFDQSLTEDPNVNRLADTFHLFTSVVSNPLLRGVSVILFLNKIDLLEAKLNRGIQLTKYWPEYGRGDNNFEAVWRFFRTKFRDVVRRAEDEQAEEAEARERRRLYVHTTVATSTKQIKAILMSVRDSVLRETLRVTGLVG